MHGTHEGDSEQDQPRLIEVVVTEQEAKWKVRSLHWREQAQQQQAGDQNAELGRSHAGSVAPLSIP